MSVYNNYPGNNSNEIRVRQNKTYQDSNIFGNKQQSDFTITKEARTDLNKESKTRLNQTNTSSIAFGNGQFQDPRGGEELYRKGDTGKTNSTFEPKYNYISPKRAKQEQIWGVSTTNNPNSFYQKTTSNTQNEEPSHHSRKFNSLSSNIFHQQDSIPNTKAPATKEESIYPATAQWSQVSRPSTSNNQDYQAKEKKKEEMNSKIFETPESPRMDFQNKSEANFTSADADKRKQNRNYSNLFGNEFSGKKSSDSGMQKQNEKLIPATTKWSQIDSANLNGPKLSPSNKDTPLSPRAVKQISLISSLDNGTNNHELNQAQNKKESSDKKEFVLGRNENTKDLRQKELVSSILGSPPRDYGKGQEQLKSVIKEFDLDQIPKNFEAANFKKFCSENGLQIVEMSDEYNNLKNVSSGKGKLKVRIRGDKDEAFLKKNLKEVGVRLTPHKEDHKRKSNYSQAADLKWSNNNFQIEERRLNGRDYVNSKVSRMNELESHEGLLGDSNAGHWGNEWKMMNSSSSGKKDDGIISTKEDVVKAGNWKTSMRRLEEKMQAQKFEKATHEYNK